MFNNKFCIMDNLLDGFTFDELITAVQSNEPEINEKTVEKVFNEILQAQLKDARFLLKTKMQNILKECK